MTNKLFSIACFVLALVMGAWAWNHYFAKPRITTKIEWVERPIYIPVLTAVKPGVPIKPTAETVRRDTIWQTAPCDSIRAMAIEMSRPDSVEFDEPFEFADSLASFKAREITKIKHDPWTHLFTKTREYQDATLKVMKVSTTETTTAISWTASVIALIVGFVMALLIG